eukprot:m.40235 g.40235  ORF g.40235 m.40235 type:complete len:53 (+) comp12736_c0_seq2:691-849(+)
MDSLGEQVSISSTTMEAEESDNQRQPVLTERKDGRRTNDRKGQQDGAKKMVS